ncbi:basic blue protein-like [Actinidia eriantha]|uniref:basic blue protein-like n=1 Tax=Actinidia eriantha TaxID=165200 RepID=UPI0025897CFE|nr:basic blue protein-like [Actinidia eriantha]
MALKYHLGRCSTSQAVVFATTLLLLQLKTIHTATFIFGDSSGWAFSVVNWPNGKKFKAGDTPIFNYDPSDQNVVVVNRNGYTSCTSSATSVIHTSGNDQVKLLKGRHYFMCIVPSHCDAGNDKSLKEFESKDNLVVDSGTRSSLDEGKFMLGKQFMRIQQESLSHS